MSQMLEIWTNDDHSEFAAKISGVQGFILRTKLIEDFTKIIYAVPCSAKSVDGLAEALNAVLRQMERGE